MADVSDVSDASAGRKEHWEERGYLLLEQALSPPEVATLLAAVDRTIDSIGDREPRGGGGVFSQGTGGAVKVAQAISQTDALDALTDHPAVFPWLLELLGPFLQILGTEIFLRRPGPGREPLLAWHTDGGPTMGRFLPSPGNPVLQMKAQFFLTDLSEPDSGNFLLVPGSHRRLFPEAGFSLDESPPGAIQILAKPGDLLLFPWSLWHAVAPNGSGRVRKSVTFRYGPMWCRPYDYERLPADVLARMTPRRRRLFGDLGEGAPPHAYFYPDEKEHLRLILENGR